MTRPNESLVEYLLAVLIIAMATALGVLLRSRVGTIDVAMLYLLAVVVVAARYRGGPALFAALLSVAAFDFFFVPPYYTFNVRDSRYYLTFVVMLVVAVTMSRLTSRIRRQADAATARERLTSALYAFDQDLEAVRDRKQLLAVASRHLGRAAGGKATVVIVEPPSAGAAPNWPPGGELENVASRLAASAAYLSGKPKESDSHSGAGVLAIPLKTPARTLGVVIARDDEADPSLPERDLRIVEALADHVALALERTMGREQGEAARVELETERLRTALLSSLSHDLRSPLASIEGAASTLVQDSASMPPATRRDLAETILEEARRMHRMVGNLLDMVRVEAGMLAVHKTWQPLEEVLGVALIRMDHRLEGHPVTARLDPDLPLVPIDELLIEQVFINLLENAVKYTPPGTPITITTKATTDAIEVTVADEGPGVPAGEEEEVFRRFHRARSADGLAGGAGLGLTICRGIITAHGGRIWIEPETPKGLIVRFTLPREGAPPPAVVEAAA